MKLGNILGGTAFVVWLLASSAILFQVNVRGGGSRFGYLALAFVYIFPWGLLLLRAAVSRKLSLRLAIRTYFATLFSYLAGCALFYVSLVVTTAYGERLPALGYIPYIGVASSCGLFGVMQLLGWLACVPLAKRSLAFGLMIGGPAFIGLVCVGVYCAVAQSATGWSRWVAVSHLLWFAVFYGPALLFTTVALAVLIGEDPQPVQQFEVPG